MTDDDRERTALLGALDAARRHVLTATEGLTDAQLRSASLPSGWTPIGLVRHLTLGGERYWFDTVVGGTALDWWPHDDPSLDEGRPADWRVASEEPCGVVLDGYRAAIARSDRILAAAALDAAPRLREADWPPDRFADVRSIVVHVLVETATHAGHLDASLELLDGRRHLVL